MKLSLIFLVLPCLCFCQIDPPPNGIKIRDSLYLDATEIANIHWLEFEYHVKKDSSEAFWKSVLPDTTLMTEEIDNYFRSKDFRYYPLVGITYEQALIYCKWRTNVVNQAFSEQRGYLVNYRLPTEEEWELGAALIDTAKVKKFVLASDTDERSKPSLQNIYFPKQVECCPNIKAKKFFNYLGNVAELVAERGVVKGGSWRHALSSSLPSKRIVIDTKKAYDWVGFRCITDILPLAN